jgi:hypothetical protein
VEEAEEERRETGSEETIATVMTGAQLLDGGDDRENSL